MQKILLKTSGILPSQDFVKPDTIRMILDRWLHQDKQGLPPSPLVKRGKNGEYIAIDGHNLLVVSDLFDGECEVFLVEGKDDILTIEDCPDTSREFVIDRNGELKEKFSIVDGLAYQMQEKGILSIADLRHSVPYLESVERATLFLDSWEMEERK